MKEKLIVHCDRIIVAGLLLLVFCLPFSKALAVFFTWGAVGFWLIKKALCFATAHSGQWSIPPGLVKAAAVLFIASALSVIVSVYVGMSLEALMAKVTRHILLLFVVIETINTRKRLRSMLAVMVLSAILIICDCAFQYFTGRDFLRRFPLANLTASFPSSNSLAGWAAMFIFIFFGTLRVDLFSEYKTRYTQGIAIFLLALLGVCFALTYSRGALIGFMMGTALVIYWMSRLFALRKKLAVYLLAVCVCAGIFFIAPRSISARIKSIAVINVSSWERINLWRESLSIAEDFPVFGSGLNTYSAIAKEYKITPIGGIYPHNSFLHMLAESGVVGLTAFIILVVYSMGVALRALRSTNNSFVLGMLAGIVSFLTQSFFDVNLYALQLAIFFWFMLGLLVSASRLDWQV